MKRVRISWGISCLIITIAVIGLVGYNWYKQGCEWYGIFIAGICYAGSSYCVWRVIDEFLEDAQHRYEDEKQSKED